MLPLMPSLTPLRYPMPYPTTQAATVQPATRSQVSPLGIVNAQWMVARGTGITDPGGKDPNATRPSTTSSMTGTGWPESLDGRGDLRLISQRDRGGAAQVADP